MIDADAAAAVNQAMTLAVHAATQEHPEGFTITSISHDSLLLAGERTMEPTFFGAAVGATRTTIHDQLLLVTAAIVVATSESEGDRSSKAAAL